MKRAGLLTSFSIGLIMLASTGRAAVIQTTTYDFLYNAPFPSLFLSQPNMDIHEPHEVYVGPETSVDHPVLQIGFTMEGLSTPELAGERLNLSTTIDYPMPVLDQWVIYWDNVSRIEGSLEFGENAEVTKWQFGVLNEEGGLTRIVSSSEAKVLDTLPFSDVQNPELALGTVYYDLWTWDPQDMGFATRPGFWETTSSSYCYRSEDGSEVPCVQPIPLPASGFLLGGGVALFFASSILLRRGGLRFSNQTS